MIATSIFIAADDTVPEMLRHPGMPNKIPAADGLPDSSEKPVKRRKVKKHGDKEQECKGIAAAADLERIAGTGAEVCNG